MAVKGSDNRPLTGVIFEPFEEVKKVLSLVPQAPQDSLARQKYSDDCEAAINEQIKWVLFLLFFYKVSLALLFLNICGYLFLLCFLAVLDF